MKDTTVRELNPTILRNALIQYCIVIQLLYFCIKIFISQFCLWKERSKRLKLNLKKLFSRMVLKTKIRTVSYRICDTQNIFEFIEKATPNLSNFSARQ